MADYGWLAVAFPEEHGGYAGTFVDLALILEQLGRGLVPEPFLPTLVGAVAIARYGDATQHETFLAPVLAGERSLAFAHDERSSRFGVEGIITKADASDGGYVLHGEKMWVDNGHAGDFIVVTARVSEGLGLFVVDRDLDGVVLTPVRTIDGRRAAHVRLAGARVPGTRRLGDGDATRAVRKLLDLGAAATVAEGLGVVAETLRRTLDYLRTREQFGVAIGSFQALQHRAVDMFVEVELLRSASMAAALRLGDRSDDEREAAVSAAKRQLGVGGIYVARQAIQLHGGIGVTDEHDIGLFFKRAHVLAVRFGDADHHLTRF
jgi:alkylation response protein AidB-like acyl-CoA dehydrogenase